ncbi:hypothetical protein [Streptomyces beijiangensis]|uniref:ARB-07466-like C-terminal domain-containing protein n=1 Tax=Streptomyces beijiangensis TaxID=163361 RepID=A0A939F1G9_9ACTN|nr:hypothetical protein [Streptomyces beijiangensis]MBO0510460.1 hypothetical protein [Streptomyces beijiangensis]
MSQTASLPRRGRLLRTAAAVAVLLAVAGYLVAQYETGGGGPPRCTVSSADGDTYRMSPEQAVNASTISAVGTTRGMPERAVTIALATALQESGLRNLAHGDRDSLGLFQQRPSQGWGNARQIMDPAYAAGKFYDHLAEVPGYSRLPLTVAAQRVQRSGFPQAYAKHEPDAALLSAALTGRTQAAVTCSAAKGTTPGSAARVRTELARDFGPGALPKAPDAGSGAVVDLPVPSAKATAGGPGQPQRGWELAHWAVAHSSELRIERVSYAGQEWTAGHSGNGWQKQNTDGKAAGQTAGVRLTLSK